MTTQSSDTDEYLSPPTPDGVPLLGNGFAFSRDPVGAMEEWADLGDIVRIETPGRTTYLVTHPKYIKRILIDDHDKFTISDDQQETFSGIEDHAVTTTTGDRWKRLRSALQLAFTSNTIDRYGDRMTASTAEYINEWNEDEKFDLYEEMRRLTINILGDTLLNTNLKGREDIIMEAADALVNRANFQRPGQFLPDWIPTPTDRRFKQSVRKLDNFVDDVIIDHRNNELGDDVCSVLLSAYNRGELSLDEVRHNLVAILLAGHDSPSVALTYAWCLIDDHPAIRDSLEAEYQEVIGDGRPTSESYIDLDYTQNVVSETLRLYPPTLGVTRQATTSVILGDYKLPADAQLLMPQWVVHRDPRFWDNPTTFDPPRWQESDVRPEYAYFPFSGGPRNCIGTHFARQELTLVLATMIGNVELDVSIDGQLTFTPSIQLRPQPDIHATVTTRDL